MKKDTSIITMTGVDNFNLQPGDHIDIGNGRIVKIVSVQSNTEFTVKGASWWVRLRWYLSDQWFYLKLDVGLWWRRRFK